MISRPLRQGFSSSARVGRSRLSKKGFYQCGDVGEGEGIKAFVDKINLKKFSNNSRAWGSRPSKSSFSNNARFWNQGLLRRQGF